ncbi:MAG TPA: serine/threonine-protein kinase [Gemmatimonadales bacterium]|nr:serine/threonine-protein kinase [Gemmatimonadales bacterium]
MTAQPIDWSRVTELFTATFEASPEERRRVLDAEATDAELRRQVEVLLEAHDSADGALDRPAIVSLAELKASTLAPVGSLVGRTLGPYRVIREIGRGGMGAVYEGERCDAQFEQRVAIKTLRIGADSEAVLQRFRQERRILAALQHPNIAALYDGGVTEEGLPYFVLEYVDGKPIDEACAERRLELRGRLDLFRQVVGAVQYAHRQLVIHRDLKPSNILVTTDGVVKLVDFGIAKLLEPETAELTADTRGPLTIPYASPEQVKGEPITTATDVYSLGVVLYRLLTGRNPLAVDHLSLERAIAAICHEVPVPPSRAPGDAEAPERRWGRELRGELDAIVMMALRKEPERRYPTAQALGDDIQRYLKGLPVSAAPDTLGYRVRTTVRRHRALVTGAVLAVAALLGGAAVALWQAHLARLEARRATEVSRFLQTVIGAGDVSAASNGPRLGPGATVAELVDSASRRVALEFADDPETRAAIHLGFAHAFQAQERLVDARAQYDSARLIIQRRFGPRRIEVAKALAGLSEIEWLEGGIHADSLAQQARALYEQLGQTRTSEYAEVLHALGVRAAFLGSWQHGDTLVREALRIHRSLGAAPSVAKAMTLADLTAIEETTGSLSAEATAAGYRTALAMLDSVPGAEVVEKGGVLWYAARLETTRGNLGAADSLSREALRVAERAAGKYSQATALALVQLAETARGRGDSAGGFPYIERAVEVLREHPGMIPVTRERVQMEYARYLVLRKDFAGADSAARLAYQSRLRTRNVPYMAEAGQTLGFVLRSAGRFAESETVLLDAYRKALSLGSASHPVAQFIAGSLVLLYDAWGRPQAAEPYLATMPASVQTAFRARMRKPTTH